MQPRGSSAAAAAAAPAAAAAWSFGHKQEMCSAG